MVIADSHSSILGSGYANAQPPGGSGHLARSVDPTQYSAALYMVDVATRNMDQQFSQFLTVFSDIA